MKRWGYFATLLATLLAADTKRPITEIDLYGFHWIANAQISPDGSKVVYTQIRVTPKHDAYENALWIVSVVGGTPRQLTSGPDDNEARWSPDGRTVAFLRGQPAQIWLLSMD